MTVLYCVFSNDGAACSRAATGTLDQNCLTIPGEMAPFIAGSCKKEREVGREKLLQSAGKDKSLVNPERTRKSLVSWRGGDIFI
jgi:hypothetical protein